MHSFNCIYISYLHDIFTGTRCIDYLQFAGKSAVLAFVRPCLDLLADTNEQLRVRREVINRLADFFFDSIEIWISGR